jgi:hypothetical protein
MTLTEVPTLKVNADADAWDSRSCFEVGMLIAHYLQEHPPPPEAVYAKDWVDWSERLVRLGRRRLAEAGVSPLRSLDGDA